MAVVLRKRGASRTYWIAFYDQQRKQVWERVGSDKREAEALDRQRKREVADGTYAKAAKPTMRFGDWLRAWLERRTNRNAKDDRRVVERFLLSREWLTSLRCEEMRPRHSAQLVRELKTERHPDTREPIAEKYVSNIYGLYRTAVQDARGEDLILVDPCILKRGTIRRRSAPGTRLPYRAGEVLALLTCADLEARMFMALAILTGMREGEVCGRRWRDYDDYATAGRGAKPLGCLSIETQYSDQPLKTARRVREHARKAPVHPDLAAMLKWWWLEGFEAVYCRRPTLDDFIVPRTRDGKPHTKSSGYKLFRRACEVAGVAVRSLHSTRHTFISACVNGGAPREIVERVTHNASGEVIDQYTHMVWPTLCDAVLCFRMLLDPDLDQGAVEAVFPEGERWRRRELKPALLPAKGGNTRRNGDPGADADPPESPQEPSRAAGYCAGQDSPTRAERLRDLVLEAKDAALRGDEPGTLKPLAKGAALLAGKAASRG